MSGRLIQSSLDSGQSPASATQVIPFICSRILLAWSRLCKVTLKGVPMNNEELTAIVGKVLGKAPAWVRHDLGSADKAVRARAEDALAAMIAAALEAGHDVAKG